MLVEMRLDKNSVCIFYKIKDDGTRKAIGTGFFFIDNDLVATARHIMEDYANAQEPYTLLIRPSQLRRSRGLETTRFSYTY